MVLLEFKVLQELLAQLVMMVLLVLKDRRVLPDRKGTKVRKV